MNFEKLAKSKKTLLVTGPAGSGKSRLAKDIHERSGRGSEPFYHVNLCSFSSGLFESELFGHARGAFTGAHAEKLGFAAAVGKGTLFLDEVGDIGPEIQAKLLMLLEEGIFYAVGGTKKKKFIGRLIFATNRNLVEMVEKGAFRRDLYHRLMTFEIKCPGLAQMTEKEEIIERFFTNAKISQGMPALIMNKPLKLFLMNYGWPGNFRELKNLMEYICLSASSVAGEEHLPPYLGRREDVVFMEPDYRRAMESYERMYLVKMLSQRAFRINLTAREINISKVTLLSKIKKYDIKKEYNNLHSEAYRCEKLPSEKAV